VTGDRAPAAARPVVAFVPDLMDQSRIRAAIPDATFVRDPAAATGAAVVIVDLARAADRITAIRAATTGRIVAYGSHVDELALAAARDAGADVVMARSRFFRDPAATIVAEG
jgi:hypothetical protein